MPARFDVFLSHSSTDKPLVEELARRLTREKLKPWLDKWNLIPGTAWQPEIEAALADCTTCAVIVGAGGFGTWHHEEMRMAIGRRVEDREHAFRVIPVLLPGVQRPERSKLPGFLTATTWVEFRDTLDDPEAFRRLLWGIRGVDTEDRAGGTAFEGGNPYRGLELFDVEHAPLFFGREALTEWLLDALKRKPSAVENRFLAIVGASGSGKSSLARAGLMAALKDGRLEGSAAWPRAICRPGAEPFFNLAKAMTGLAPESVSAVVFDRLQGRKDGERSLHVAAGLALGEPPRADRLVVLVDQFEEVFTLCTDESERGAFIANLLHAATVAGGRTVVVLTMRADFYPRCASNADLAAALSDHQVLVGPMTEDELRRAIDRPARLAGLEPEAGLVELLVDDIRGRAGALPLLQFALQEVWRRREDYRLTIRTYREIGEIEGALQRKADAVFDSFTPEQQELCRRVFLRLVQPGEGSEDTRRRASIRELLPDDPTQAGAVRAIIDRLADPESRLLTTERQQTASGEGTLEVAHEALIRGWPQLRKWIETDRAGLWTHRRLTDAAKEWAAARPEHKADYLYSGARLAVCRELAATHRGELSGVEVAFYGESERAERERIQAARSAARLRAAAVVVPVTALVLFAATILYMGQREEIRKRDEVVFAQETERRRLAGEQKRERDRLAESERKAIDALRTGARFYLSLLKRREGNYEEADRLLDQISSARDLGKFFKELPAEDRTRILDQFRLKDSYWQIVLMKNRAKYLDLASGLESVVEEHRTEQLTTRWRMVDAHRLDGRVQEALAVAEELIADDGMDDPMRIAILGDYVWMLLPGAEGGATGAAGPADWQGGALRAVDRWLVDPTGKPREAYRPLLLERARIRAAAGDRAGAGRDLDDLLVRIPDRMPYGDVADAYLLRGFLREDDGGRRLDWEAGVSRWSGRRADGDAPGAGGGDGVEMRRRYKRNYYFVILSSLTDQLDKARAQSIFLQDVLLPDRIRNQALSEFARTAALKMFNEEYIYATMNSMFRSRRGNAVARRIALRQMPLQDWFVEPLLLAVYEAVRQDARLADSLPEELDDQLWDGLKAQVEAYNLGRIGNPEIILLLTMWKGDIGTLGWRRVEARLGADVLPITAYVLGRRFSALDQQRPAADSAGIFGRIRNVAGIEHRQSAAFFFERALQAAPPGSPLSKAAEQALAEVRTPPNPPPGS